MSDKTKADVLNGLGDGAKENNFCGDFAGGGDHGDGIDDWDGIEKSLDENVPDGSDIAIFDVDGAKQEGETKREKINFKNGWNGEEPSWTRSDAVDESEDNNNDEVDEHIDDSG